ncbi:dipeptidase [Nocardia camponoti]|uniref:Dipeptidase n=1 Tax=Nocardia camponoti TaxID=1616106 RepID=A0A917VBW7_9NOCA|nr:dipeptidase [Nocardia camponoti]GGK59274.1 dipeptidase [Nocardia camponoti]
MTTDATELADLQAKVKALMGRAKTDLAQLVSFKSVADARQFPPKGCEEAAQWVADAFAAVGLTDVGLHETPDGSKAVVASRPAPPGAPTVVLYCHYDVQPPLGEDEWKTPVWQLTEVNGRWYGRGAADCKGNIVMLLTALRAIGPDYPVGITLVSEGSEEQGTGGLEQFIPQRPDLLESDAILVCDCGNIKDGIPTLTQTLRGFVNLDVHVKTLAGAVHSGMFGGPAPDAIAALIHMLSSMRDVNGNTTIDGLDNTQTWGGAQYDVDQFRKDARVLPGVDLLGSGTVADQLWARPAVTVLGMDVPPVVGSSSAIQGHASARINLRIPPGTKPEDARDLLEKRLRAHLPWNADLTIDNVTLGSPFVASQAGPARDALADAMAAAYGRPTTTAGQGGSIPLCNALAETYPEAEMMLLGVEEPKCHIHAPNESVDPNEIERLAVSVGLFLKNYRV